MAIRDLKWEGRNIITALVIIFGIIVIFLNVYGHIDDRTSAFVLGISTVLISIGVLTERFQNRTKN